MKSETAAIVGGCVAGGVVLIILLSVVIYCLCQKRKHKRHREQKKFRPISPHISPAHSQPSTLGQIPHDQRLPKVNSTGLWFGVPNMHAYYYDRPYDINYHRGHQLHHIPRAASETRIPQQTMPPLGQRIYRSQQLAPVYEMPPTAGHDLEIYGVYQFAGGNSSSKLLETKHSQSYNKEFWMNNSNSRLERSKSDAQDKQKGRENKRRSPKDKAPVHKGPKRSTSSAENASRKHAGPIQKSQESLKVVGVPKVNDGHSNQGFAADPSSLERVSSTKQKTAPPLANGTAGVVSTIVTPSGNNSPSATDSMKLRANNKTDDQKTIVPSAGQVSVMVNKEGENNSHHHYVYQGDIYAIPGKSSKIITNHKDDDNPILSRMKEMVIEKSRTSVPNYPRSDSINTSHEPGTFSLDSSVYQEIPTNQNATTSSVTKDKADSDVLDGLDLPEPSELCKEGKENVTLNHKETVSTAPPGPLEVTAVPEHDTGETTSPVALRSHPQLSPNESLDAEGTHEDISKAGKRITESAFTFLDRYLSDDDGTDTHVESPPMSPRAQQVK